MDSIIRVAIRNGNWNPGLKIPGKNRYAYVGDTIIVQLTKGKYCMISPDDIDLFTNRAWCYAGCVKNRDACLHRMIMDRIDGGRYGTVRHLNGNLLDNRRCNLHRVGYLCETQPYIPSIGVKGMTYTFTNGKLLGPTPVLIHNKYISL